MKPGDTIYYLTAQCKRWRRAVVVDEAFFGFVLVRKNKLEHVMDPTAVRANKPETLPKGADYEI